jgi:diadenosine tetraphosphate (Ap4A) HIT family hydrolase
MPGCLACDLASGATPLPGGLIHETNAWRVEHCVGPLGLGTLVVKPKRHVTHVADLDRVESDELGPLLRRVGIVVRRLSDAEHAYVCLWSHGPAHIHFVVQPVSQGVVEDAGVQGPALQAAMFQRAEEADNRAIEESAERARQLIGMGLS